MFDVHLTDGERIVDVVRIVEMRGSDAWSVSGKQKSTAYVIRHTRRRLLSRLIPEKL